MGNTCKPMAVSFQCMTKSTTNKKKLKKKTCNACERQDTLTQNTKIEKTIFLKICEDCEQKFFQKYISE